LAASHDLASYLNPAVQQFIYEFPHADTRELILNPPAAIRGFEKIVAEQLNSRQKARKKIPSWYQQTGTVFPPALSLEQCSSDLTAQYKASLLSGDHLIDLTGGMGVDCLAMHHHFSQTTYVEKDPWLCQLFQHNAGLVTDKIRVVNTSAEDFIQHNPPKGSYYLDPSRRSESHQKVFKLADCVPDLNQILPDILSVAEVVLVKLSPMLDIQAGIAALNPFEVHVVSVQNECKELLFLITPDFQGEPTIICSHCNGLQWEKFSFTFSAERNCAASYGNLRTYLYDANVSITKAGAFKSIAAAIGLQKIAPNTHLYTHEEIIENFPGRIIQITHWDVNKQDLKKLCPTGQINVITRNYVTNTATLKQQLRLKDGGDQFLIGYRDLNGKGRLVVGILV